MRKLQTHFSGSNVVRRMLFLMLLLGSAGTWAQKTVTGTVSDPDGLTLPGVTVSVKGTNEAVVTDIDGRYSINAAGDATLVFSFVGFVSQEVAVNNQIGRAHV